MNIIDNRNTSNFDFNSSYSVMDVEKTKIIETNHKEFKIENFHLLSDSNNGPDFNNQKSDDIIKEDSNFSNAMSLNTIINNDENQHEDLLFNDPSRTLPPLTDLGTPKSASISISTLLNTTSSPSSSSTSSEVTINTSIDSYSLSPAVSQQNSHPNSNQSDTLSNQYTRTRTNTNAETSFYNNEDSNQQIINSKTPLGVSERFINKNDDIINKNNLINNYSLNDANFTTEKNSNKNDNFNSFCMYNTNNDEKSSKNVISNNDYYPTKNNIYDANNYRKNEIINDNNKNVNTNFNHFGINNSTYYPNNVTVNTFNGNVSLNSSSNATCNDSVSNYIKSETNQGMMRFNDDNKFNNNYNNNNNNNNNNGNNNNNNNFNNINNNNNNYNNNYNENPINTTIMPSNNFPVNFTAANNVNSNMIMSNNIATTSYPTTSSNSIVSTPSINNNIQNNINMNNEKFNYNPMNNTNYNNNNYYNSNDTTINTYSSMKYYTYNGNECPPQNKYCVNNNSNMYQNNQSVTTQIPKGFNKKQESKIDYYVYDKDESIPGNFSDFILYNMGNNNGKKLKNKESPNGSFESNKTTKHHKSNKMNQVSEFKLNDSFSYFTLNNEKEKDNFFNLNNESNISTSYTTPMIYPPNNDPNKVPKKGPKILCHTCTLKFSCKFCSRTFSRLNNLVIHQKSHLNKQEFKCEVCSQIFSRKHDLTRHQRIHSGEKPFHCDICGKSFSRMDALKRHERINLNNSDHCKVIIPPIPSKKIKKSGTSRKRKTLSPNSVDAHSSDSSC